jgi:putative addiction module component (TIGR02574 family)
MSARLKELFEEASRLPETERASLAALLIESLESEWDTGVDAAWATEIERRVGELDRGDVDAIPWAQVRERLLSRLDEG